jgi:mono/diheme cytochrome c family protein
MDEVLTINDGGTVRTQVWHYPSRGECLVCHTPTGGFALGFNTAQMNRDFDYGSGASNQIAAMSAAGYFTGPVSNIYALHALAVGTNENVSREWRVRSYLAANCAQCHQPGGSALGFWNASITNSTASAGLIDGPLNNYFTNANARVIAPGSLSNSMLLTRISTRGLTQMPPLASSVLDTGAIALVSAWITNDLANGWTNTVAPLSTAVTRTNGGVAVQFNHPMNRAYRVDTATNLSPPVAWQFLNVPENRPFYPASNAPATVPDAITNTTQKFYRVRVSAP